LKVLYAALRHDPRDPDLASGSDYNYFHAIKRYADEVRIVGPFQQPPPLVERAFRKLYKKITGKRYIKWDFYTIWESSKTLNVYERAWQPDIVFSMFPATLARYSGQAACVFRTDLTFQAWQEHGAGFGDLAIKFLNWLEGQAVSRSDVVIAQSRWGKDEIIRRHGTNPEKIRILTNPSALPMRVIPVSIDIRVEKKIETPLRLLLVGRDFVRKGVDIALEIVKQINERGVPAELTICATSGPEVPHVCYVGPFLKSDPQQLADYVGLYQRAHLLLHPARFEGAGIVPSEAAAFAVPTITNDTGGLGTTVADGTSGIVLPKNSPSKAYVEAIIELMADPERYFSLCSTTRQRYERELNWEVAGERVAAILRSVVNKAYKRAS
jgi:glycosyltransferase involved in cell wall biosynthesis